MKMITVKLEHCYGIRSLNFEFDFSKKSAVIVYAPNGMMKTSFAKTFRDLSEGKPTNDRVYPDRISSVSVRLEDESELKAESVFVVEPYDSNYESDRVSSLLVNKDLKMEYDSRLESINSKVAELLEILKNRSGIKLDLKELFSLVITKRSDNLLRAFDRVRKEVLEDTIDGSLKDVEFNVIFNTKVESFLTDDTIKAALEEYTETYENLLSKSRFFRKGVFNHYQANEIAKQLKNHGFFEADHKIFLSDGEKETKVTTVEELQKIISEELETILKNDGLKAAFNKIDKKISNSELRTFRDFLLNHQVLIPRLIEPDVLKEDILKYYLMEQRDKFEELMNIYDAGKKRLAQIAEEATKQATEWQNVISVFNKRFTVPFTVVMQNKEDVILKRVTPNVGFEFEDEQANPKSVERDQLIQVLSNGENRALYILNVIFEIRARIADKIPTLLVIDDIADSFDYKNKYAIIQYLADVLKEPMFHQIIFTHNYDFYRTVWRRLELSGAAFHADRKNGEIVFNKEQMYQHPFEKWKKLADVDAKKRCLFAMIPFVRNLAEYCELKKDAALLTNALHIKLIEPDLKVKDMLDVFKRVLNGHEFEVNGIEEKNVIDCLKDIAKNITKDEDPAMDLELKVILSIAIRLLAEEFMIAKIQDDTWVSGIKKNQTTKLMTKFKELANNNADLVDAAEIVDRVNLMTPENIHLNSFMYEPLLDMSLEHLKILYKDVSNIDS